jgi:uncharacterized protein (DUF1697 family)
MTATQPYVVLLRGVNVGGRNKLAMGALRERLADLGFDSPSTYIASGNVVLESDQSPERIQRAVQTLLTDGFDLDDELIRVLALDAPTFRSVLDDRPPGFGDQPGTFHSDVIFLIGIDAGEAMGAFNPREGVDRIWPGRGVIYSQRLSAQRTRSRLSTVVASPLYQAMTIRSWSTTVRLGELLDERETAPTTGLR